MATPAFRGVQVGRLGLLASAAVLAGPAMVPAVTSLHPVIAVAANDAAVSVVDGTVLWLAVSPGYRQTGLVLASASATHCSHSCMRLWASHDGGATWHITRAGGWGQGRFFIASARDGHDVVFGEAPSSLQRSDDAGETWHDIGATGSPAASPGFARDATVAVAAPGAQADYVIRGANASTVTGSGGAWEDLGFMLSPAYPSGGRYAPVLLSAADQRTQAPVIQQCDAGFTCRSATTLAGAGVWAVPVMLYPSTTFADDGTVFAKAGRAIYKSTTGGQAFAPLLVLPDHDGSVTAYPMLALAPGYSETGAERTVYAAALQVTVDTTDPHRASNAGGVYRSTDGGTTWARLGSPSPLDTGASAVAVAPDGRLFAGFIGGPDGAAGLLCSSEGSTWATTCPPLHRTDRSVGRPGTGTFSATPTVGCAAPCTSSATSVGAAGAPVASSSSGSAPGSLSATGGGVDSATQHGLRSLTLEISMAMLVGCACLALIRRWGGFFGRQARGVHLDGGRPATGARDSARNRRNMPYQTEVIGREQNNSG